MRKYYVTIYDLQMRKVAYLENAFGIQYETPFNGIWTASFSLPVDDPKNVECQPLYFAEIFDESERLELYRILPSSLKRGTEDMITYRCEHVLGTLLDDLLYKHHTVGNLGYYTADVLRYILQRQSVQRWRLGTVDFRHQFEYNWEHENILGALLSVPKPFSDEYMWTWDTTAYPWTLNLVRPSNDVQAYIRYGVNMQGIERTIDPSNIVTRIYGLGYGEGDNQLTFSALNNGKPYLDAEPEYIQRYGIMQSVFVDRKFEYADTLMARCRAILDELKQPRVSYVVQASELYALTKDPIHKFRTGAMARVQDKEVGEDVTFRVLNVRKADAIGAPGNVEIEIANRPQDVSGSIAELRNRQYAADTYSQGATNIDTRDLAENCDPTHPAVLKFLIPEEAVRINKVRLTFECQPFRAYSRAIDGGGAFASTTAAGGGTWVSSESEDYDNSPLYYTGENVGYIGTYPDGNHYHVVDAGYTDWSGDHNHKVDDHVHYNNLIPHTHDVMIPAHSHGFSIPAHTHQIQFGIYEGPTPNAVSIKVDGNLIPGTSASATDLDIIPYLAKDDSGRIKRGYWHTISIVPNSLGRVIASVVTQIFVQSRGAGDY